jgi:hypothetical protein
MTLSKTKHSGNGIVRMHLWSLDMALLPSGVAAISDMVSG